MRLAKTAAFFCAFFFLLAGCMSSGNKEKKRYNLSIVIDTASNFYLDSITIDKSFRADSIPGNYPSVYDSAYKSYAYRFDSVEAGELVISLQSRLDKQYHRQIALESDTTIFLSKNELPVFITGNPDNLIFASMTAGDKICIGYGSSGCFHHYRDKIIIKRDADDYLIDFYSTRTISRDNKPTKTSKRLRPDFKDSLAVFQATIADFIRNNNLDVCTTSQSFYIQRNDTVYRIYDGTCNGVIRYAAIIKPIMPEWFEVSPAQ